MSCKGTQTGQLADQEGCSFLEAEASDQARHDVALQVGSPLDLTAHPVAWLAAPLQRAGREDREEVGAGGDLGRDDALELAAVDALHIREYIKAMRAQVVEHGPRNE